MKRKVYDVNMAERQEVLVRLAGILSAMDNIAFSYVYGSFHEGMPFRDIDIGVYLNSGPDSSFALDLAARLSSAVRFPVDVRVLNGAPPAFLHAVFRGSILTERDEELRASIVEDATRRYLDLKPVIRQTTREAFAAWD